MFPFIFGWKSRKTGTKNMIYGGGWDGDNLIQGYNRGGVLDIFDSISVSLSRVYYYKMIVCYVNFSQIWLKFQNRQWKYGRWSSICRIYLISLSLTLLYLSFFLFLHQDILEVKKNLSRVNGLISVIATLIIFSYFELSVIGN